MMEKLNRMWVKSEMTQCIAKIKLGFSSPRIIDLIVERSKENFLVFLLILNNSLPLHKINQISLFISIQKSFIENKSILKLN